jgi:hypothetical protein
MNKFLFIVLILFFTVAIFIGANALSENVNPDSRASAHCPPQQFPNNKQCPSGTQMELIKNSNGCFEFGCK